MFKELGNVLMRYSQYEGNHNWCLMSCALYEIICIIATTGLLKSTPLVLSHTEERINIYNIGSYFCQHKFIGVVFTPYDVKVYSFFGIYALVTAPRVSSLTPQFLHCNLVLRGNPIKNNCNQHVLYVGKRKQTALCFVYDYF